MAVIVNGDGILTGISSLATALTDLTSGRGTVTGVATVGTLQLGAGVSISSPRSQTAAIFTNNTEFFTVDDAGRVGVGTITPNSDAHPENEKKINVGFITAKSIAGDIDARNVVVAGISTFVGSVSIADKIIHTGNTDTTIRFPGDDILTVELSGTEHLRVDTTALRITDKLAHTGDPDTMIRFPAADTVTVETGGSERLRIDSSGKLGLGIASPNAMTHIVSDQNAETDRFSSSNYHLMLQNTGNDTGEAVGMGFAISDDTAKVGGAILFERSGGGSAGDLEFFTNSDGASVTERLRITSGGKVNIGGDFTNTSSTLRVIGDSNAGSQTYLEKSSGSTNNTYNTALTISSRSTGSAAANYGPAINFQHAFGASNYAGCMLASLCNADANTADLVFYPRNYGFTEALRINSSGQLVMSRATTTEFIQLTSTNNNTRAVITTSGKDSSGNAVTIKVGGFGDTSRGEIFTSTNHDLGFATNNAAAQFKMKTGGDFEIVNGNLVVASGHGIDFSASGQASGMSSELLEDYEEGTFGIGVTDNNNTFTTGQESGRYIKIGNVVHCTFIINCAISGTSGYAFFVTGFPFTVKNYGSHANEGLGTCKGTGQEIQLEAQQDQTTVKARNPSSGSAMSVNDIGCTNNTVKSIRGYIVYHTT